MKQASFPNLLAQGRVGPLTVRNRITMPPMCVHYGSGEGYVTQRSIDYYRARARGGVGLLCVEVAAVDSARGRVVRREFGIDDDRFLPGLSEVASAVKGEGALAWLQLHHTGRETYDWQEGDPEPVSASAIPSAYPGIPAPRPMTHPEIEDVIGRFVEAAARARRAGFDGVEVHAAHGYLLTQFLSPLANKRVDEYGGPLANRARLMLEVVRRIKARLGPEYPVSLRISADEDVPGGTTLEEMREVARWLEEAGADLLSVSRGSSSIVSAVVVPPSWYKPGFLMPLVAKIKSAVGIPVIGVGRLNTPEVAEAAIRDGCCDFVALGRPLIVDPEFPNKVASGHRSEIRPCIACMHCLAVGRTSPGGVACALNPTVGRDGEPDISPAGERKKVVVVGGGPAGMEAARVAALRGHEVTLFEQSDRLGGQLAAAAVPPHKSDVDLLRQYYLDQMAIRGVKTLLGVKPDSAAVIAAKPDAVIVATGSQIQVPVAPTTDGPNVVTADDVLLGQAETGARVVVLGGELVGCETAEHLAQQGKRVTIVRRSAQTLGASVNRLLRPALIKRLTDLGVEALTGVSYEEINSRGLVVTTAEGERRLLEADTVVVTSRSTSSDELAEALRGRVPVVEIVGDAVKPRHFLEAIREGRSAGLAV